MLHFDDILTVPALLQELMPEPHCRHRPASIAGACGGAMTYMDTMLGVQGRSQDDGADPERTTRDALIVIVEDELDLSSTFRNVCDCLHVTIERMPPHEDLGALLRQRRPMAVVAEMDTAGQDGCHVLKVVAAHDRDLPVLLVVDNDPVLLGAIDAVQEIWQLTSVVKWSQPPGVGAVVDFLFQAGRKGDCMRLMSS